MEANVYVLDSNHTNKYVIASEPNFDVTTKQTIGEYVELVRVDETDDLTLNQTDMCYSDKSIMYIPYFEDGKIVLRALNDSNGYGSSNDEVNRTSASLVQISSDSCDHVLQNNKNESPQVVAQNHENQVLLFNDSNNKVDFLPEIYNKRNRLELDTSLDTHSVQHNVGTKIMPLSGYVHDAYRMHQDVSVNSGTRYAQERYMLYSGSKCRLKNSTRQCTESLKMIPPKQFKSQLMDTKDIVTPLTLSPHTKKLVAISELNYNRSLYNPIHCVPRCVRNNFTRNCVTGQENNDIDVKELELQPLGFTRVIDYSKIKRITRKRKNRMPLEQVYIPTSNEDDASTEIVPSSNIQLSTHTGLIDNNVEVLLSGNDEEGNFFYEGETSGKEQIIVIHDGRETTESSTYTQKNIEVLLAAAAEEDSVSFCNQQGQVVSVETENDTLISNNNQQIIIVGSVFHNNELTHDK